MHEHLRALAQAAADNDAVAEERGLEAALTDLGLDAPDVMSIAEQRAMRLVLTRAGKPLPGSAEFVPLTRDEMADVVTLTVCCMDGIAIGWRARGAA